MTIASISDTRIAGTIDAPELDGGDESIVFDIPVVNPDEPDSGGVYAGGAPTYCCTPADAGH